MTRCQRIHKERRKRKNTHYILCLQIVIVAVSASFLWGRQTDRSKAQESLPSIIKLNEEELTAPVNEPDNNRSEPAASQDKLLILVNKDNIFPNDYEIELKVLPDRVNQADILAYDSLCAMLKEGRKEGLRFEICSSYRTIERQQELLEEDIAYIMRRGSSYVEAYSKATQETMPPGYSEHSTGLAFDIVSLSYQILDDKQEKTAENIWLREHCMEYGFILRYPKEKESITGINYESWHFRYVGVEAAVSITEMGITLEEYLDIEPESNTPQQTAGY